MRRRLIQTCNTVQSVRGGVALLRTFIFVAILFSTTLLLFASDRAVKPIGTFVVHFGEATPWPPSPVRRRKATANEIIHAPHSSEEEPPSAGEIGSKGHQHDHQTSSLGQSRPAELPSEAHAYGARGGGPPFSLPGKGLVGEGQEALLDVTLSDRRVFAGTKSEGLAELPLPLRYEGATRSSRREGDGEILSIFSKNEKNSIVLNHHERSVSDLKVSGRKSHHQALHTAAVNGPREEEHAPQQIRSAAKNGKQEENDRVSYLDSEKSDEDVVPLPPPHVDPRLLGLGRRRMPRRETKKRTYALLGGKGKESFSPPHTYPLVGGDDGKEGKDANTIHKKRMPSAAAQVASVGTGSRIADVLGRQDGEKKGQNEHDMPPPPVLSHDVPYEAPAAARAPSHLRRVAPPGEEEVNIGESTVEGFPMAEERAKREPRVHAHKMVANMYEGRALPLPTSHQPRMLPRGVLAHAEHHQQGNFEDEELKVFKAAEDAVNGQQYLLSTPVSTGKESPPSVPSPSPQINNEDAGGGLAALDFSGFEGLLGENGTSSSTSSFPSNFSESSSSSSSSFSSSSSSSGDGGSGSTTPTPTTPTPTTPTPTTPPYMGPCIPCPEYGLSPYEQLKLNMSNGVAHVVKYAINVSNDEWGYEAVRYCSPCNTSGGLTYVMKPAVEGELVACIVGALMGIVASVGYILSLRFCCKKTLRGRKDGGVGKAPRGMMATAEDEEMTLTPGERMGMGDRGAVEEFAENYQQQQQQQMLMQMMGMMNAANGGRSGGPPPATRALPPGGGGGGRPSAVPPSPAPRG